MTGYTPDEKLRLQQLRELRRRWLKDQELSPREPVLPPKRMWPMEAFWNKFLQDRAPWKNMIYKVYRNSIFAVTHLLIPTWIVHYYVKYHVSAKPYAIVARKPRIFPLWYQTAKPVFCGLTSITAALNDIKALIFCTTVGDTILETGEVIPPMKEFPDQHH